MKIKTDLFCSLATSPSWQSWLYNYNVELYRYFIRHLQNTRGCGQNKELMKDMINQISIAGGNDTLLDFITSNYPNMIDGHVKSLDSVQSDDVFAFYDSRILSYPRRIILEGEQYLLKKRVAEFLLDKIKYDSIIIGNKAYIEYLTREDKNLVDKIPNNNWQIANYRLRNTNGS